MGVINITSSEPKDLGINLKAISKSFEDSLVWQKQLIDALRSLDSEGHPEIQQICLHQVDAYDQTRYLKNLFSELDERENGKAEGETSGTTKTSGINEDGSGADSHENENLDRKVMEGKKMW